MRDIRQLQTEAEAKAYLHPVRSRILQFLAAEALTISQTAQKLGVHPANITHHFRKLEKAGLIKLTEERDTGRVIEKYYRSVARMFEVRRENVSLSGAGQRALHLLRQDMQAAAAQLPPDAEDLICMLASVSISRRSFERFKKKLEKLVQEFRRAEETSEEGGNCKRYSLNVSLYPRDPDASHRKPEETPEQE